MKKIFIFLAIIVVILCVILYQYNSYQRAQNAINSENSEYEQYLDKEIYGIDIASLINKSTDKNEKNSVSKDDKGYFIQNDENSIEVEVYIAEDEKKYELQMEQIYNAGTEQFVQYYGNTKFKCTKIEYHKKTGRVKYILFEQEENS